MTFEEIVTKARDEFGQADISKIEGKLAIQFNLTGTGAGTFYAEVKDGRLSVEPYEYIDRDVLITISGPDFVKMMGKKLDPVLAFSTGRLKVDGDIGKALEVNKLIV